MSKTPQQSLNSFLYLPFKFKTMSALTATQFNFPKQKSFYKGKVRDVYNIDDKYLVMVASDRISAFDVVLPKGIPFKGQVLNQIASKFLNATKDIVPTGSCKFRSKHRHCVAVHRLVHANTFFTTLKSCSGLNGLTIQPVAPAALPSCRFRSCDSVVRINIGVNL